MYRRQNKLNNLNSMKNRNTYFNIHAIWIKTTPCPPRSIFWMHLKYIWQLQSGWEKKEEVSNVLLSKRKRKNECASRWWLTLCVINGSAIVVSTTVTMTVSSHSMRPTGTENGVLTWKKRLKAPVTEELVISWLSVLTGYNSVLWPLSLMSV